MSNIRLILASSSVYRQELLRRLELPFECISPKIDESARAGETPLALSSRLAREKAQAVRAEHSDAVVIGSDQVCEVEGVALGKPHTFERARAQLRLMSGKKALFHTALCVVDSNGAIQECVSDTVVQMRPLSDEAIDDYLHREEPYQCAGSAKIECLGIALMESVVSDDPTSLIGLPLIRLTSMLAKAGIPPIRGLLP